MNDLEVSIGRAKRQPNEYNESANVHLNALVGHT